MTAGRPRAWLKLPNSLSPNARTPANLLISRPATPSLDFLGFAAMFAQPLGSPSGYMSNKITKLLIVVVPRRTAGDGYGQRHSGGVHGASWPLFYFPSYEASTSKPKAA